MKYLSFVALASVVLIIFSCQSPDSGKSTTISADSTYTLTGKIKGFDSGWIFLAHRQTPDRKTDSVRIKNGEFVFSGKTAAPEFCNIGAIREGKKDFYFGFFLQNGILTLNGNKDSLTDVAVRITGSSTEDEFKNFQQSEKSIDSTDNLLESAYNEAKTKKNQPQLDSITKAFNESNKVRVQMAVDYAAAHTSSYVSAFEIYSNFSYNPDADKLGKIYRKLDSTIQASYFGKKIYYTMDIAQKTNIGKPAPEFALNDINGKPVALSSFKGKYVLIDFWASWWGPCRAENPSVVKAYKQFHAKGFDIFGVSLDDNKEDWSKAIKKDQLNWTQVSDLRGWENSAAQEYGVQGIPMNFLLDKEGNIIGKGLRGQDLDKKLSETITR